MVRSPVRILVVWVGLLMAMAPACHKGMRTGVRTDSGTRHEDARTMATVEDARSDDPTIDAQVPRDAALEAEPADAAFDEAIGGETASSDSGIPVERAKIVREGTNFGRTTVIVYSDASAVRTRERNAFPSSSGDAAPVVDVLPPGSPEVVKFLQDLSLLNGVGGLGGQDVYCPGQSISNSTRTYVTADGMISRNLECAEGATVFDPQFTADCKALAIGWYP